MASNRRVAGLVAGVAVGMFALAYASVPLYQLFCQVTGYGGTTQRAEAAPDHTVDRWITVSFNADVATDLPWNFRPAERSVRVKVGEPMLVHYVAENTGREPVVGTATFNVAPSKVGAYFNKLECFCFTEQVLKPGERVEMPVTNREETQTADKATGWPRFVGILADQQDRRRRTEHWRAMPPPRLHRPQWHGLGVRR